MSGRGRGRGRGRSSGRGGRSAGRSSQQGEKKTERSLARVMDKSRLEDNIYTIGSDRQGSDFIVTTRFIMNLIQRTFPQGGDIESALRSKKEFDFNAVRPRIQKTTIDPQVDQEGHREEQLMCDSEYKTALAEHAKRVTAYRTNKIKAYGTLWKQCAKTLQEKIKNRSDFETKIEYNPIELIKVIEEMATSYEDNAYHAAGVMDSIRSLLLIRQKENEDLSDYTLRYNNMKDILISHMGGDVPFTFAKAIDAQLAIDPKADTKKAQLDAWNECLAYNYLDRALKDRYGSLVENMKTQFSMNNNQYPKNVIKAAAILDTYKWDNKQKPSQSQPKSKNDGKGKSNNNNNDSTKTVKTDDSTVVSEITMAQLEGSCHTCGKKGHYSNKCPLKDDKIPEAQRA